MADSQVITPEEIWKAIPGFPAYEVSDQGRVRYFWKRVPLGRGRGSKMVLSNTPRGVLKPSFVNGYPHITLRREGIVYGALIHRLVLLVFRGPCPKGMESCHNDGTRDNNCLDNLRWDTLKNNQLDRRKHGTNHVNVGEKSHKAKLTDAKVIKIREMFAQGDYLYTDIAKVFSVNPETIRRVVLRKNWTHI